MDKGKAKKQVYKGEAVFIRRLSNTRSIFACEQDGKFYAFVYLKGKKQVEDLLITDCIRISECEEIYRRHHAPVKPGTVIPHKTISIYTPVEIPGFKPKVLGWKPVGSTTPVRVSYASDNQKKVRRLMERDGVNCVYCGKECFLSVYGKEPVATLDHFVPKSKGGSDSMTNLVMACFPCNNRKGDMDPHEFMKLIWGEDLSGCPHNIS